MTPSSGADEQSTVSRRHQLLLFVPGAAASQTSRDHRRVGLLRAVDDAADEVGERPGASAADEIARWRRELAACFEGREPQTRQGRALAPLVTTFRLSREPFESLIEGVEMDVGTRRRDLCGAVSALHPRRVGRRPRLPRHLWQSRRRLAASDRSRRRAAAHEHPPRRPR